MMMKDNSLGRLAAIIEYVKLAIHTWTKPADFGRCIGKNNFHHVASWMFNSRYSEGHVSYVTIMSLCKNFNKGINSTSERGSDFNMFHWA